MIKPLIAPSLLSANFCNLYSDIDMVNRSEADWLHLDIMDGVFVPNITFGMPVTAAIKSVAKKPLDVHLMIVQPERYIADFAQCGADILTVHWEACSHLHRVICQIKERNMRAGVSLNPHTPIAMLEDIITETDLVLLMSVNPGFGGQTFIERTLKRVSELKELIARNNSRALIEIDGGVSIANAAQLVNAGADVLVAGNAIFKDSHPEAMIAQLKICNH